MRQAERARTPTSVTRIQTHKQHSMSGLKFVKVKFQMDGNKNRVGQNESVLGSGRIEKKVHEEKMKQHIGICFILFIEKVCLFNFSACILR